jgi:hypothetical protein
MPSKRQLEQSSYGIAHHLPHRTRLKLPHQHRDKQTIQRVHDSIKKIPGVSSIQVNDRTGSVVVHHEPSEGILQSIGEALEGVSDELFDAMLEAGGIEFPGLSIMGHLIKNSMSKVDNHVAEATGNLLDLKMLLPIGFLAAALYKAFKTEGWFTQVPTYVLFYYAYDSYMKFHGPSVRTASAHERPDNGAYAEKN